MKRILVVEDNGQDLEPLAGLLREHGYAMVEDITGRNPVEEELRRSNDILRAIIDAAPTAILGMDLEGNVRHVWNAAAEKMLGWSAEEVMGRQLPSVSEESREEYLALRERKRRGDTVSGVEVRRLRRDGTPIEYSIYSAPLHDAEGRISGNVGVLVDITERRRAEEALRFTQFAVDRMTVQAFWITSDGHFFYVNDAACRSLGYTRGELVSMSVPDIDPVYTAEMFAGSWLRLRELGSETFETLHRAKDGRVYPVEVRTNYVVFDGKEYNCAFVMDITERKRAEEAVRISEQNYRDIFEHAPFGIIRSTRDGKLLCVNPAAVRILKYDSPEDLLETVNRASIQEVLFAEPSLRGPMVKRIFSVDSWHAFENRYRCKDGSVITCMVHSRRVLDKGAGEAEFESFLENITYRVEAEAALLESEEKFRLLAETSPTAIILLQGERIVFANRAAVHLTGFSGEETLGWRFWDYVHEDFRELVRERGLARQRGEAVPGRYEIKIVTKTGEERWLSVSVATMAYRGKPTGIVTLLDITEAKHAEERISAALAEKEVLLREIHHRVKNNLQVISALLDLQSDYIRDEQSLGFFRESRDRIKTMALVHERLYNSTDMASIDFGEYVRNLAAHLSFSYVDDPDRIALKVDVAELSLGIEEAIPCGLIINELVSNSLKHAFPGGRRGVISVDCRTDGEGLVMLGIRDNGVGFPDGLDFRNTETLGLQIVILLTKQLRGTIEQRNVQGASFSLRFRCDGSPAS